MACKDCKHMKSVYVSYFKQGKPNNNVLNIPWGHTYCDKSTGDKSLIKNRDMVAKFCPLTLEERKQNEI